MISPFVSMGYFNRFLSVTTAETEDDKDHYRKCIREMANKYKDYTFDIVRKPNKQYFPLVHGNNNDVNVKFEDVHIIKALKYCLVEEIESALTKVLPI